jgi:hypothetical protein
MNQCHRPKYLQPSFLLVLIATTNLALGFSSNLLALGEASSVDAGTAPKTYQGAVELDESANANPLKSPAEQIDAVVSKTIADRPKYHLASHRRMLGKARDMAQYCTSYKGFESSSEAADVILAEKVTLKSKAALEYVKQKDFDSLHADVTACVLQIAMGIGTEDAERRSQLVNDGVQTLKGLVGDEQATNCLHCVTASLDKAKSEAKFDGRSWDVLEMQRKSAQILKHEIEGDDVVKEIVAHLHKYNRHSNLSRVSAKVINLTLSVAELTPNFISPAAQVAEIIYIALTGGPEEAKLLKEVYLDRRLEERVRRVSQEANLALTNYNLAKVTKNPVLLNCSESIVRAMVGEESTTALLHEAKVEDAKFAAPVDPGVSLKAQTQI